jgi:hypothetical protein
MGREGLFSDFFRFFFATNAVHPIPSAWDWYFSNCGPSWVVVSLKNGAQWGGYLGARSFISSATEERDIFLEKVYRLDSNGSFSTEKDSSVLICKDEIQSIEIWPEQVTLNEQR